MWHDYAPACCIRHQVQELPLTQGGYRPSDLHTINTHHGLGYNFNET
ncbi:MULTISPECIES: hypothetical protein [Eikenella]|nr:MULTISPECIES: hypothetical protein [Eikenella]